MNNYKIIIYSTNACPFCLMLKDYLTSKNIFFTEKLVDTDEMAKEEMVKISNGFLGVPFTSITKPDEMIENIIGFDKGKLDQILSL